MRLSNRFLAIFHALLLAILAIGFALSWSTYEQGRGAHFRYLNDGGAYPWNFERWNYAVAWSLDPSRLAVSRSTLLGLCQQAWAARVLILCAFTLAGLALAVQLSAWRQHGRDQAWRGQSHGGERSSQASTIAVKENGVEAVSLGEQTPSEAEARGDARN